MKKKSLLTIAVLILASLASASAVFTNGTYNLYVQQGFEADELSNGTYTAISLFTAYPNTMFSNYGQNLYLGHMRSYKSYYAPYIVNFLTPANDSWVTDLNVTAIANSSTTPLVNATMQCNTTTFSNSSAVLNATPFYLNNTVPDGWYYCNMTVNSTTWLSNTSETRLFKVDSTLPVLILYSPQNATYYSVVLNINYDVIEANLDTVWYELNSANTTLVGNTTVSMGEGYYNFTLWANDSVGNINHTTVFFTVTFIAPPRGVSGGGGGILVNITNETNITVVTGYVNESLLPLPIPAPKPTIEQKEEAKPAVDVTRVVGVLVTILLGIAITFGRNAS